MLNKNLLKAEWIKMGYNQKDIAKMLGISPKTLSLKLKKGSLGIDEAEVLISKLSIKNPVEIFFNIS